MATPRVPSTRRTAPPLLERVPPASFFVTSAVFHYLGPSMAVLLFPHVAPLGVMWLRIASAAVIFAVWRRPWRILSVLDRGQLVQLAALGTLLAVMNSVFYLAVAQLPLATVGAIEFLGTMVLAAIGARSVRNVLALGMAVGGVALLTVFKVVADPLGFLYAFSNCAAFMLYVVLGHRVANSAAVRPGTKRRASTGGIDQLGMAMLVAAVLAAPVGAASAGSAFAAPVWLVWGAGVGFSSSVVPYVTDQLAMTRMPRATFALMLALLPACATIMGVVVLRQIPTIADVLGVGLVIVGLLLHTPPVTDRPHGQQVLDR